MCQESTYGYEIITEDIEAKCISEKYSEYEE